MRKFTRGYKFGDAQKKFFIIAAILELMAIISIICALNIGNGLNPRKGDDPKDYYGTYYANDGANIYSFDIDANECIIEEDKGVKKIINKYDYEYVSSSYAHFALDTEEYKDCDAIFIYTDDNKENAITMWITSNQPYSFVLNSTGWEFSTDSISFDELMNSPKDFYTKYYLSENSYVNFYKDGKSYLRFDDGIIPNTKYIYANQAWMTKNTNSNLGPSLVVYNEELDKVWLFEYHEDYLMLDGLKYNEYIFKINYDLDGGTNYHSNPLYYDNFEGNKIEEPTRPGYEFIGWSGTGIKGVQKEVTLSAQLFENIELKANWKTKKLSVILDYGYNIPNTTIYVEMGEKYELPRPTRPGYNFDKWINEMHIYVPLTGKWNSPKVEKLTAIWNCAKYTIEYELDGGKNDKLNPSDYFYNSNDIKLSYPTKSGYDFIGWSGTDIEGIQIDVIIPKYSIGNKVYKANWKPTTYTITLDLNGGECEKTEINVDYKTEANLPIPTREYHDFVGWYLPSGERFYGKYNFTYDITLKARWNLPKPLLHFDTNGGQLENNVMVVETDKLIKLPIPEKIGYQFIDWTYLETGEHFNKIVLNWNVNYYFKANYKKIVYTLKIDDNTENSSIVDKTYDIDDCPVTIKNPTNEGYTFTGWTMDDDTETLYKNLIITIENIGDHSLTANWKANKYTITLDLNGGSCQNDKISVTYGYTYYLPTPTKNGYEFLGWYFNGNVFPSNSRFTNAGDITVKARWELKTYSISYHLGEGQNNLENIDSFNCDDGIIYLKDAIAPKLYKFDGWYLESNFLNKITQLDSSKISNDINVYAKYSFEGLIYSWDDILLIDDTLIDKNYVLMNDIEATSKHYIGSNYTNGFKGTFDGNGFTIKNLSDCIFINIDSTGVVKNLKVTINYKSGFETSSPIAENNYGTIKNCSASGVIISNEAGGIVYRNDGLIENCTSDVNITSSQRAAGIAIINDLHGQIKNCSYNGHIQLVFNSNTEPKLISTDNFTKTTTGLDGLISKKTEYIRDNLVCIVGARPIAFVAREKSNLINNKYSGTITSETKEDEIIDHSNEFVRYESAIGTNNRGESISYRYEVYSCIQTSTKFVSDISESID